MSYSVQGIVHHAIQATPELVAFGAIQLGLAEEAEVLLTSRFASEWSIESASSSSPHLTVTATESADPNSDEVVLRIRQEAVEEGPVTNEVLVEASAGGMQFPPLRVPVTYVGVQRMDRQGARD